MSGIGIQSALIQHPVSLCCKTVELCVVHAVHSNQALFKCNFAFYLLTKVNPTESDVILFSHTGHKFNSCETKI